jgi:hypothetical protein
MQFILPKDQTLSLRFKKVMDSKRVVELNGARVEDGLAAAAPFLFVLKWVVIGRGIFPFLSRIMKISITDE